MDEKILYQDSGVTVTPTRFISGATTYAIRNVTSVREYQKTPSATAAILLILFGIVMLFANPFAGVPLVALGVYVYRQIKTSYHVMLTTASGEASAFNSMDQKNVTKIVAALNQAIVEGK